MKIDALIAFFDEFAPHSVARLAEFYSADAYFKDPFNEVRGVEAIARIFRHMFTQVAEPRFVISEKVVDANGAVLIWQFHFCSKGWRGGQPQLLRGASHLRFDAAGKVVFHRDYWDTGEELYGKLALVGWFIRRLRRALAAR